MGDRTTLIDKIKRLLKSDKSSEAKSKQKKQKPKDGANQRKSDWKFFLKITKTYYKQKRFQKAKKSVKLGLKNFPKNIELLKIATDVYRASGNRDKSLEYSELLITHHPDNWNGYGRAAQDLSVLKRFNESQEKVQAGLEKIPNQINLLTIATDVYRASGDREKSLEYSLPKTHSMLIFCLIK